MRGGVVRAQDLVVAPADNLTFRRQEDGADRNLAGTLGGTSLLEGELHPALGEVGAHALSLAEVLAGLSFERKEKGLEDGDTRLGELLCGREAQLGR